MSQNWVKDLHGARKMIEAWRMDYNCYRPHRSLKGLTPEEFAKNQNLLLTA